MTNIKKKCLELTESDLLAIKDKIQKWNTKDKVIDMMRLRYGQLTDKAA